MAYVQIVNATSVPEISLTINDKLFYPQLKQGEWTGDCPWPDLSIRASASDLSTGAKSDSDPIRFQPSKHQTLVIMGDFSKGVPPGTLRQPSVAEVASDKEYPPNILFRVYSHEMGPGDRKLRFRFINGMPGTTVTLKSASVQPIKILPAGEFVLNEQPKPAFYEAEAMGKIIKIPLMHPENINQTVVFYLKAGEPVFCTFTEPTTK